MTTSHTPKISGDKAHLSDVSVESTMEGYRDSIQLLSRSKFVPHHPKAGINPLVDAGGYLFSIIGKLKRLTFHHHLNSLYNDLITEIKNFEHTAKTQGYSAEYILVSRYALCASIDDIISSTSWGNQSKWNAYSLLNAFNQETAAQGRFFMLLEQIMKNPNQYIDLMEFMYICLSLGFKGGYRNAEISNNQLEHICNVLYKHIRAHHGTFSKTLSPFPIQPTPKLAQTTKKIPVYLIAFSTLIIIFGLFVSLVFLLDTFSTKPYKELLHIRNLIQYEKNHL